MQIHQDGVVTFSACGLDRLDTVIGQIYAVARPGQQFAGDELVGRAILGEQEFAPDGRQFLLGDLADWGHVFLLATRPVQFLEQGRHRKRRAKGHSALDHRMTALMPLCQQADDQHAASRQFAGVGDAVPGALIDHHAVIKRRTRLQRVDAGQWHKLNLPAPRAQLSANLVAQALLTDAQAHRRCGPRWRTDVTNGVAEVHGERHREEEPRAFRELAFDRDHAAQRVHDLGADCETQPRTLCASGQGKIHLHEFAEQLVLKLRLDADAGVRHLETQIALFLVFARLQMDFDVDQTTVGELECVTDQIYQHLADARRVADHKTRDLGIDKKRDV